MGLYTVRVLIMVARYVTAMAPYIVVLAIVPGINMGRCIVQRLLAEVQRAIVMVKSNVPEVANLGVLSIVFLGKSNDSR